MLRLTLAILLLLLGLLPVRAANQASGEEIYGPCAACHGRYGHGGKRGEYPRLAGQKAAYIEKQLRQFRDRKRLNMPMLPYTQEREMSEKDIAEIAAYLSNIALPSKYPDFKESDDALTRLTAMEMVMIVPKLDGDLENGSRLYGDECAYCHGKNGMGRGRFPMLVGQYTNYLKKQIDAYLRNERPHDVVEDDEEEEDSRPAKTKAKPAKPAGILHKISAKDINDILAYLTHLQDSQP